MARERAEEVPGAAPFLRFQRLKARPEFLRAARGRKSARDGMIVQGWDRSDEGAPRVGFTCSKRVGNAVARNRAKRRLRAAADAVVPGLGRPGWDYVLIGRSEITASRPFALLCADLEAAMRKIHAERRR